MMFHAAVEVTLLLLAAASAAPAATPPTPNAPIPAESTVPAPSDPSDRASPSSVAPFSPLADVLGDDGGGCASLSDQIAACDPCSRGRVYAFGELLIWQPRRASLDFAIADPIDDLSAQGRIASLELETRLGYRVGVGVVHRTGDWDFGATYVYFHSNDQQALSAPPGGSIYGTWAAPSDLGGEFVSAVASANLDYDVVDVELARRCQFAKGLDLRLAVGPRIAAIHQKLQANYALATGGSLAVSSPAKFDGVGLRVAGAASQRLGAGFQLFGRAGAALILGSSDASHREVDPSGATFLDVSSSTNSAVPVIDLATGLTWTWRFIDVAVGYEVTHWFNLVDSPDVVEFLGNPGKIAWRTSDLDLNGLFVRLGIQF